MSPDLECTKANPRWAAALTEFFERLKAGGDETYFHPHRLDAEEAARRCSYTGRDLYYLLVNGEEVLGYGMLRGWDQGHSVPSLGIALDGRWRGHGLGRMFMLFLHSAARLRGSRRIRLKVHPDNEAALNLYRSLGYRFGEREAGQMVGFLDL